MSEVTKLRSKVVEIEAMQFTGGAENATSIINWILEKGGTARYLAKGEVDYDLHSDFIMVDTLEGTVAASSGWWIFYDLEGEFYPCWDSVKVAKYDEVD